MPDDPDPRRRFRLIRGQADAEYRLGPVVVSAPPSGPLDLDRVDAVVLEEDTWLVMSTSPEISLPTEHPVRVMNAALDWEPRKPGELIVRPGRPTRLLAVVYDFTVEPPSRPEWVAAALERILDAPARRPLGRIALPLLGTRHGELEPERVLALLREACERAEKTPVARLVLRLDDDLDRDLLRILGDPVTPP